MKINSARFKRNAIAISTITAAALCLFRLTPAFAADNAGRSAQTLQYHPRRQKSLDRQQPSSATPTQGDASGSGTHAAAGGEACPELDDATQRAPQLATSDRAGPIMGIVASMLALAGGARLFAARAVRRHMGQA